jgi:N-formylglutamate amidohydrolase
MIERSARSWRLRALGMLVVLGAFACTSDGAPTGNPARPPLPPPALDVAPWVSSEDGTIPLVIVAPHGGTLTPSELPDRACLGCVTVNDANTRLLAVEISDAFQRRIGGRPFVVANLLSRTKFDANRALAEATASYAPLAPLHDLFHVRIDSAKARATRLHPHALLIDLHGHGHAIARLELGYLLTGANLRLADSALGPMLGSTSIARLGTASVAGDSGALLVRGPRAMGTRFTDAGFEAVPSANQPAPAEADPYFNGGYNTQRHGSRWGGPVDAVQIECHYTGVRDTALARTAFAEAFVTVMLQYLADHYGWTPA